MKYISGIIGGIIGGLVVFAVSTIIQPKQAFVKNQVLFAQFKGKQDQEAKLVALQERHKQVLDSLGLQLQGLQSQADKVDAFMKQRDFYMKIQQEFAQEEQQKSAAYTEQIWSQINQYMSDYGKQEGYEYIFGTQGSGSMMYAEESKDITEEVIKYINSKYEGL